MSNFVGNTNAHKMLSTTYTISSTIDIMAHDMNLKRIKNRCVIKYFVCKKNSLRPHLTIIEAGSMIFSNRNGLRLKE